MCRILISNDSHEIFPYGKTIFVLNQTLYCIFYNKVIPVADSVVVSKELKLEFAKKTVLQHIKKEVECNVCVSKKKNNVKMKKIE